MTRMGMIVYLMLATAVGPSLFCCCASRHLAESLLLAGRRSDRVVESGRRQCCRCHEGSSAPQEGPRRTPMPGNSRCPNCPCKQVGLSGALPSQDAELLNQALVRLAFAMPAGFLHFVPQSFARLTGLELGGIGRGAVLPFLSAHDFVATLHILRC